MKAGGVNASMTGSAVPNGLIDTDDIKTVWAKYISKFMQSYADKGVKIWGVTPQNEPEFPAPWEACAYTPDFEKDFVTGFLGPTLRQDHPDALILAYDHNKVCYVILYSVLFCLVLFSLVYISFCYRIYI